MTKEALGELILSSERQLYATAKTILSDDQDCADAIQESIVKAFSKIDTLKKDRYAKIMFSDPMMEFISNTIQ